MFTMFSTILGSVRDPALMSAMSIHAEVMLPGHVHEPIQHASLVQMEKTQPAQPVVKIKDLSGSRVEIMINDGPKVLYRKQRLTQSTNHLVSNWNAYYTKFAPEYATALHLHDGEKYYGYFPEIPGKVIHSIWDDKTKITKEVLATFVKQGWVPMCGGIKFVIDKVGYLPVISDGCLDKGELYPDQDIVMETVDRILNPSKEMEDDFTNLRQWVTDFLTARHHKAQRSYFLRQRTIVEGSPEFNRTFKPGFGSGHDIKKDDEIKLFRCEVGVYVAWEKNFFGMPTGGSKKVGQKRCCQVARKNESNKYKAVSHEGMQYICDNENEHFLERCY